MRRADLADLVRHDLAFAPRVTVGRSRVIHAITQGCRRGKSKETCGKLPWVILGSRKRPGIVLVFPGRMNAMIFFRYSSIRQAYLCTLGTSRTHQAS
jgi:hypothetical protein